MLLRTLRTQVKWILVFFLLVFVLAIPLMYGVGGGKNKGQNGNRDYPVAEIDGKTVTRRQLMEAVQGYVERAGIKDVTSADLPMIRKIVVDQMVTNVALEKEVKALGIKPSEEELKAAVKEISDQFPTKEAFMQYMDNSGITEKKLEEELKGQLAERILLQEAGAAAAVEEKELQDLYESVKSLVFTIPEGVELLLAEFSNEEAADKAYGELSDGTSWDVVMEGFTSQDVKSRTSSDKTVFIRKTALTDNLSFIASMDEGTYAAPVEVASDDFLLVYLEKMKDQEIVPFEEAKERLENMVLSQKRQQLQQQFLSDISEKVKLNILDPSIFPEDKPVEATAPVSEDKTASSDITSGDK